MRAVWARAAGIVMLMMCVSVPALALEKIQDGVYAIDAENMDDLLELEAHPDMRVLLLNDIQERSTSEVHAKALRNWIESGGVVWVEGDAAESPLVSLVEKEIKVEDFDFQKATTGKKGGELVVRDQSDNLKIHDHPLTEGVRQLYIYAARKFDGTRGLQPVVEMADEEGEQGVVIGAVPIGEGYLVLDGTRRAGSNLMFWRKRGFDEKHPNAVRQAGGKWEDYDWDRLVENAKSMGKAASSPKTSS
jgi:hypothetical protein